MTHSADQSAEIPSAVQKPGRAVQNTAPGVFGARELPSQEASLGTGDVVGGRFEVSRYLGSSGGGISYLCVDQQSGDDVVVKVLAMPSPGKAKFDQMYSVVRTASGIQHKNLTRIIGMGRTPSGEAFVAMEFVRGSTVSAILAQYRERNKRLTLRDAFTIVAHIASALEAVHEKMCHAVLTPYNVYLDRRGVVRVGNLAFGRIAAEFLLEHHQGPYVDSIYVAPESAEAPELINDAADIYILGMMTAELLSARGLPATRDEAKVMVAAALSDYPPGVLELVMAAIGEDLAGRPRSAAEYRDRLQKIIENEGVVLSGAPPEGALPIEPAVVESDEDDIFDIPELGGVGADPSEAANQRYLVSKNGLDYGPFTAEDVLAQLYSDEITEHTEILDRVAQERKELGEMARFRKEVQEYIPRREERLRREAEARAELERKVKKGGVAALVIGIVVGLAVLVTMGALYLMQPDPEPLPMDKAFASLDFKFQPPPKEFQTVAVDNDLLNSIFNPRASEEEIARAIKKRQKKRRGSRKARRAQKPSSAEGTEVQTMDMAAGSGTDHILTDQEVNDVILASFGGLRSCILKQLKRDSRFKGVTVQFFIRPTGTTGGVKIRESDYRDSAVAECLTSRFRSMKFPEHGGLNRGVTYPLRVQ